MEPLDGLGMAFEFCESIGLDAAEIAGRLEILDLADEGSLRDGRALQSQVIRPNVDAILERFYDSLIDIDAFNDIISQHSDPEQLRSTQKRYLFSMGIAFDQPRYFEERLRVGSVHQRIGVPQYLYQYSFQALQSLLILHIPERMRADPSAFQQMIQFILKITALDMSLAVESYWAMRLGKLEKSLQIERGEKERLNRLATRDSLTKLHNHAHSRRLLADALANAGKDGTPMCIIMADLDHFKEVNDMHGHLTGDQVLQIVAARMIACARTGDEVCRYGGEEFLFILRNTDAAEGREVAERMRMRINSDAVRGRTASVAVTLSLGIAEAQGADDVDRIIDRADAALYAAKLAGRNCVRMAREANCPAGD